MPINRISDTSGENSLLANVDGLDTRVHTARGSTAVRNTRTLNVIGDQWYNTDINFLQVWNGSSWVNVYVPAPSISGISPTTVTGAPNTLVTINGYNFGVGATVGFVASGSGNVYLATGVNVLTSTTLTAFTPALSGAGSPYAIQVTNLDGGQGTSVTLLTTNAGTAWTTTAGTIATSYSGATFTYALQATSSLALTFSLVSGSLSGTVTLGSTGILTGTLGTISSTTTYTFVARITDTASNTVDRTFSIVVNPLPTVTTISPTTNGVPGTTVVTITGTNLVAGSTVAFVNGGTSFASAATTYVSATSMTALIPAGANVSPVNVKVTTPDNGYSVTSSQSVTLVPSITGASAVTSDATYYYAAFNSSGTLTVANTNLTADILVVGGGGQGGAYVGGGGGGGGVVQTTSSVVLTPGQYTISVGAGGAQGSGGGAEDGAVATSSQFIGPTPTNNVSFTGLGGGRGGRYPDVSGSAGGSGGGHGAFQNGGGSGGAATQTGGTGYAGYGNVGGSSQGTRPGNACIGRNGGGAGSAGTTGYGNTTPGGGAGLQMFDGYYYGGGGGGGNYHGNEGGSGGIAGNGGTGGGGGGGCTLNYAGWGYGGTGGVNVGANGVPGDQTIQSTQGNGGNGGTNTGGGGGGCGHNDRGGAGGTGRVVIRYTRSQVGG